MSTMLKSGDVSRKPLLIGLALLFSFVLSFIIIAPKEGPKDSSDTPLTENNQSSDYERKLEQRLHKLELKDKSDSNSKDIKRSPVTYPPYSSKDEENPSISYNREALPYEDFIKDYVIFLEQQELDEPSLNEKHEEQKNLNEDLSNSLYEELNIEPKNSKPLPSRERREPKSDSSKESAAYKALKKQREEAFFRALGASSSVITHSSLKEDVNLKEPVVPMNHKSSSIHESHEDSAHNNYNLKRYENLAIHNTILENEVISPKTPYALMQGTLIQAVLLTGISSELPGQVTAMLTKDVYDSIKGRHLLLPRGSRLIGQYDSRLSVGAKRLFLGFTRIIFPNGDSLNLGVMPGQSTDGKAGFDAEVNNHYFQAILSCLMLSSISTAGDTIETHTYRNGTETVVSRQGREFNSNLNNTLGNLLNNSLNLSPTLTIEPGYRFSIAMTKDIFFRNPYGQNPQRYLIP